MVRAYHEIRFSSVHPHESFFSISGVYASQILLFYWLKICPWMITNRPFHMGVASRLATAIYVAMVTPILYDNSYSPNDSNLKYESYQPYG